MMRKYRNKIIPLAILAFGLLVSAGILAKAQAVSTSSVNAGTTAVQGVTFPIPELGNCANQSDCRTYCTDPVHMDACISFARAHGLMNKEEADRAEKFSRGLGTVGGPGGCRSADECENFCSKIENIEACMKFAKEHNISVPDADEAEKVLNYIKSGGKMPGNCNSKESCEAYCSDFDHVDECLAFSEKSGLGPPPEASGPNREQLKKIMEFTKKGESPGGCKSKDQCEAYCSDSAHFEECISFAEKTGMISPQDAAMARKTGGKGPGNCNSRESCEAYCNKPENRETCFNFAKEHNLIPVEQLQQMKEGMTRLRAGLEQAPPEVTACLKSVLGPNIIDDIQSGKLVPGPDIGDRVRDCFEKFGHRGDPSEVFENAPPQVLSCLKDKLGDKFEKIRSGQEMPTPEMADAFRVCFQNVQLQGGFQGGPGGPPQGAGGPPPEMIANFLRSAPSEIAKCLKEKLGDEFDKIQSGTERPSADIGEKMRSCFESFRPQMENLGPPSREGGPGPGPQGGFPGQPGTGFNKIPPDVQTCLKESVGADVFQKLQSGEKPEGDIGEKLRACFEKFRPQMPSVPQGTQGGMMVPGAGQPPAADPFMQKCTAEFGVASANPQNWTDAQRAQISNCMAQMQAQQFNGTMPPPGGASSSFGPQEGPPSTYTQPPPPPTTSTP